MDVKRVIYGLDELNNSGREKEGEEYLEFWLREACAECDWKAELSVMSELLGQYRLTMNEVKGVDTVNKVIDIIKLHSLENTATGATILLNAATTSKCFENTDKSIELFSHVEKVFEKELDRSDYRFAGLYNNMGLTYAQMGETEKAEDSFYKALDQLEQIEESFCDRAVTYCNLYDLTKNENYLDKAAECFKRAKKDGYYNFTLSKCRGVLGDRIS